jgi:hypothetical protein
MQRTNEGKATLVHHSKPYVQIVVDYDYNKTSLIVAEK